MNEKLKKQVDIAVGFSRLSGGVLIIIGSLLVFFFIQAALDTNAVVEVNGVATADTDTKVTAVIFAVLFPAIGLFLAFASNELMDKLAVKIITRLS